MDMKLVLEACSRLSPTNYRQRLVRGSAGYKRQWIRQHINIAVVWRSTSGPNVIPTVLSGIARLTAKSIDGTQVANLALDAAPAAIKTFAN